MKRVISETQRAEAVELYRGGYSLIEVAARTGISRAQVHLIIKADAPRLMRKPFDTRANSTGLASVERARQ